MIGLWIDMLCHYVSIELHSCTIESFSTFICHAPANGQTYRWAPNEECLDGCPIRLLVEEFALLILCLRRPVMVNQFCWKNPWRKRCLNKQWVHLPKTMKREDRMRQVKKTVQLVQFWQNPEWTTCSKDISAFGGSELLGTCQFTRACHIHIPAVGENDANKLSHPTSPVLQLLFLGANHDKKAQHER